MPALATTTAEAGIGLPPELLSDVLNLAASDDFRLWERQLARCGNCANPIRLQGSIEHVNPHTGEVREVYCTDTEPAGVLLKACGNRRAAVCPGCAEVYRADAYQLIKAGLRGGKGVPDTVAAHPRVFAHLHRTLVRAGPLHPPPVPPASPSSRLPA
jgi:hypothetical protein